MGILLLSFLGILGTPKKKSLLLLEIVACSLEKSNLKGGLLTM